MVYFYTIVCTCTIKYDICQYKILVSLVHMNLLLLYPFFTIVFYIKVLFVKHIATLRSRS